jgi:hypothetical protein
MTDERVKLTRNMQGGTEIRVNQSVINEMGPDWLANELHDRGFVPTDFGQYVTRGSTVIIPIRKEEP